MIIQLLGGLVRLWLLLPKRATSFRSFLELARAHGSAIRIMIKPECQYVEQEYHPLLRFPLLTRYRLYAETTIEGARCVWECGKVLAIEWHCPHAESPEETLKRRQRLEARLDRLIRAIAKLEPTLAVQKTEWQPWIERFIENVS